MGKAARCPAGPQNNPAPTNRAAGLEQSGGHISPATSKQNAIVIHTLATALEKQGYSTLTPVQEAVTQDELGQADLLVSAQTGSGKTVGFGLAIAPTLLGDQDKFERASAPLALIIAPTRELALQVKRELAWLYGQTGAVVASCVGGMDMREERHALNRGAHIVVATPGRLRDHIQRGSLATAALRAVVLDEADEMLDLGFREDLEFILGEAPEDRRTLLFSATVPRSIATLAQKYQKDAVRISTVAETQQHADIEYRAMNVAARDGENAIINVLRYYEAPNALVFCNTRAMVNRLTTRFSNRGFSVVALSGELSQSERTHALQAMRDGRAKVCVATDVAARGIDLPKLELVIHAELPSNHETLLHRSGRTGRAGRKGVSALIVTGKVRRKAERLLNSAKVKAEWTTAPSSMDVVARDQERLMSHPTWDLPISSAETEPVEKLLARFTPEQVAAAFLRIHQQSHSAPEELATTSVDTAPPKPRGEFGPSVWFSISGGHDAGAEPRRLLPMLCKAGNLTKEDIGAIRVQTSHSFVEIRKASLKQFLAAIGDNKAIEPGAVLTQLNEAPDIANSPRPAFKAKPRHSKFSKDKDQGPHRKGGYDKGPKGDKGKAGGHKGGHKSDDHPNRDSKPAGGAGYKKNWKPEKTRPEGVVEPLKPKRPTEAAPAKPAKPRMNKKAKKRAAEAALAKSRSDYSDPSKSFKAKTGKGGNATLKRPKSNKPQTP